MQIRLTLLLGALVAACGGDSDREITTIRERAASLPPRGGRMPSTAERFGVRPRSGPDDAHADPHGGASRSPLVYDVPEGWEEVSPTRLRLVNLRVKRDPATECYLTILPGTGGGVIGNVNRWRSQIGLDPVDAAEIEKLDKLPLFGEPAHYVELAGTFRGMGGEAKSDYKLLGLVLALPPNALFLKMAGPAATVDAEKARFEKLASSLRVAPHAGGAPAETATESPRTESGLGWTKPEGWIEKPARSMRVVTFAPGKDTDAECFVAILGGGAGGVLANANRWRSQLGQPPIASTDGLETFEVLGRQATLVEAEGTYTGMGETRVDSAALLGLICDLGGRVLFVKMTGPASIIRRERANFIEFCRSLRSSS